MAQRIMLAFEPSIHKRIKSIAIKQDMTTKAVSDILMRDALERADLIFARAKKKAARGMNSARRTSITQSTPSLKG